MGAATYMKQISDKNSLLLLSSRYLVIEYWYRKLIDRSFVSDLLSIKNAAIITIQYNKSGWEKSDQITGQVLFFSVTQFRTSRTMQLQQVFSLETCRSIRSCRHEHTAIIDEYIWDRYISNPDKRKGNPYYYYYYDCQITNWGLSGLIIATCLSRWGVKAVKRTACTFSRLELLTQRMCTVCLGESFNSNISFSISALDERCAIWK
jgi:hypothetical protein